VAGLKTYQIVDGVSHVCEPVGFSDVFVDTYVVS